jgi:hypothetical protein
VTDATHAVLTNSGATGNVSSGSTVASGAGVASAGAAGSPGTGGGGGGTLTDATTSGTSVISNPTGVLKRFAPGSSNLTVTDTGSQIVLDAPGAGGGGGMLSRFTAVELFDDFTGNFTGSSGLPALGWFLSQDAGSGATLNIQSNTTTGKPELGIWQLSSQLSGTTGLARLSIGNINLGWTIGTPAAGALYTEWRAAIGALQTSANYVEYRLGINGSNTGNTYWAAAYFWYNVVTSPNWQCSAYNGSTMSSADSGVAVSTNYVKLGIAMNAAWTTATFSINGTTVATITGVNWGSGNGWSPVATVGLRAGSTAQVINLDWFYLKYSVAR